MKTRSLKVTQPLLSTRITVDDRVPGLELVSKTLKLSISWREWFLGILPMGAVLFLAVPLLSYWLYPPEIKESKGADSWAAEKLVDMGNVTRKEVMMGVLAFIALILWIFAGSWMDSTMIAITVLVAMILTGVISWDDLLEYKQAWNMLIWFVSCQQKYLSSNSLFP